MGRGAISSEWGVRYPAAAIGPTPRHPAEVGVDDDDLLGIVWGGS